VQDQGTSRIRNSAGGIAGAVIWALTWDEEGRIVPLYVKALLVPLLFLGCVWGFYPLVVAEISVLRKKPSEPSKIVGVPADESIGEPSKLWAGFVLVAIGLLMTGAVFMSGYSFKAHVGGDWLNGDGTILTGKEARVWEFRRQVLKHAESAPTREQFTKELGDAWMEAAQSLAWGLQVKDESYHDRSFDESSYEGTWKSLQRSVASFRAMSLNISENDLTD
jgi:hypothetical protein